MHSILSHGSVYMKYKQKHFFMEVQNKTAHTFKGKIGFFKKTYGK